MKQRTQYARFQVVRSLGENGPEHRSSPWKRHPDLLPAPHISYIDQDNTITDRVVERRVSSWRWLINDNRGDS